MVLWDSVVVLFTFPRIRLVPVLLVAFRKTNRSEEIVFFDVLDDFGLRQQLSSTTKVSPTRGDHLKTLLPPAL